jgi:hypothetical protein
MLIVENVIWECKLISKRSLHLFPILLREKDATNLDEEEKEILRDIDQVMLQEERYMWNNEENLSADDTIKYNRSKTNEEKIGKAEIRRVIQRKNRKYRMNHFGENYVKKEPDKGIGLSWYDISKKRRKKIDWLSKKIMEEENEMYESGSYKEKWNEDDMEDLDWSEKDRWLSRTRWKEKMKIDAERNGYVPNVNVNLMEK